MKILLSNVYRKLSQSEVILSLRSAAPDNNRHRPSRRYLPWLLCFFGVCFPFAFASASNIADHSAWDLAKSNPHALVEAAVENELKNSYGHRPPLRYLLRRITKNTDTTKEIIETRDGGVARLVAIHNRPLTVSQAQKELERLRDLASSPEAQRHRKRSEEHDAAQLTGIMRLLPDAFLNQFAGSIQTPSGVAIRLTFVPNPRFSPPTLESHVLTGIKGEIWIDPTNLRVARIEGHLFRRVDYGWGILGMLYPGGTIAIEQARTPDCGWQLSRLKLDMTGKALMLKPLHILVDETASDYHAVPAWWKYTDAIDWLLHMPATPPPQIR